MCPQKSPKPRLRRDPRQELVERGLARRPDPVVDAREDHERVRQATSAGPELPPVPPRPAALHGLVALAEGGGARHPQDRPSVDLEGEERGPDRDAVGEVLRAVDRIDDPDAVPAPAPCSSPITASAGNRASIISRSAVSTSRSACVTGRGPASGAPRTRPGSTTSRSRRRGRPARARTTAPPRTRARTLQQLPAGWKGASGSLGLRCRRPSRRPRPTP